MIIETKYSLNDNVYYISNNYEEKWISCSACGGSGIVILLDNEEHKCPECYGSGGKTKWLPKKWAIEDSGTIGLIRAEVTKGEKQKYQYMLNETGIGSGRLHYEDRLFISKEEAQKECDLRNDNNRSK